ncbi:MAG: hypothetical protein ACLT69_13610 [Intestinibacter bartlettii]
MDGIDKYYYAVKGQTTKEGQNVDAYKYSSVSIIPATSVYYEDNLVEQYNYPNWWNILQ